MRKTFRPTEGRTAIRLADGTLLAVPPMRPDLPSDVRVRIFEYVLRRQPGLAQVLADTEAEVMEARERNAGYRAASLMAERPYSRDWNEAA